MLDINKAVTYPRLIKAIYENLTDADLKYNVIEDEEFNEKYDRFYTQYIDPEYAKSFDEGMDLDDDN